MRRLFLPAAAGLAFLAAIDEAGAAEPAFPDVSRLPSHPELPDPLVTFNGQHITTKQEWFARRRPELKALFQYYMYGYAPPAAKITAATERTDAQALGGKATLREITISFGPPDTPKIHLLLVVPNARKGPAPAFVGLNFSGNHAVLADPHIRIPTGWMYPNRPGVKDNHATEAGRGKDAESWSVEDVIGRGYALATFYNGDVDPDRPDVREGIQPHLAPKGAKPGPHAWGTIAAWAWGLQRAVDYLRSDRDIDAERIIAVGHSRLGKTALLAAALDERIALAIPHQAGCGGTAPSRGKVGESVKAINSAFPHWFNATFKEFNDRPDRLPFDQHCLVALVAPRPVLFGNAVEDTWANPAGQFEVLRAADPVYRLLGVGGLEARAMPEVGTLVDSRLGYFIRPGKHSVTRGDWKMFLDFADKHLGKPAEKR
jgi:hypothetical protein